MIKTADKYGVRVEAPNPSKALRDALPIWYHQGFTLGRAPANSVSSRCLRDRHQVTTTAQCARVASRLAEARTEHATRKDCPCHDCDWDRRVLCCDNPHRCAAAAQKLVARLSPKWHPERRSNNDGLTLTASRARRNKAARVDKGRILFDPTVTVGTPLAGMFRVFTESRSDVPKVALRPPRRFQVDAEDTEVYTDGSCLENGMDDARAGSGIWFRLGDARNAGVRVPGSVQSNQSGEV
ncbi:hypothetical protein OH77DRAFT_1491284, partial [Trametes cingulata]